MKGLEGYCDGCFKYTEVESCGKCFIQHSYKNSVYCKKCYTLHEMTHR